MGYIVRSGAFLAVLGLAAATWGPLGCSPDPEVDTDGDGLSDRVELDETNTSPVMPDTDGDGLSDYDEVVTLGFDPASNPYRFNPRVADVPRLTLTFAGPPILTIETQDSLSGMTMAGASASDMMTVGVSTSTSPTTAQSNTEAISQTFMNGSSLTVPLGSSASSSSPRGTVDAASDASSDAPSDAVTDAASPEAASTAGQGATLTLTNAVSTTVSPSTTFTTSVTLTNAQMQENAVTLTRDEAVSQTVTTTAIGGFLKLPVLLQNASDVAFTVTNLVLGASLQEASGDVIALQNLLLDEGVIALFQPFSLAPWEQSGPVNFTTTVMTLDMTRAILLSGDSLVIRIGAYELNDAMGKSLSFNVADVEGRTALVVIDYGGRRIPELYQVATNANPDEAGVNAGSVFGSILQIPYETRPMVGLTSVRGVGVSSSGGPHWSVDRVHAEGPIVNDTIFGEDGAPYDFDDIEVQAGDALRVALTAPGDETWDAGSPQEPPLATAPTNDAGLQVIALDAGPGQAPSLPAAPPDDGGLPIPPVPGQ